MYAIRPPEYFPGLPFWALMLRCEHFTLADTFQYSRQTFQNRARLRNPEGWQWITVPLKGGRHGRPIRDVEIDNTVRWRGKHLRAMAFNYRATPYFEFYEDAISELIARDWLKLGPLTVASIRLVARILSLPEPSVLSDGCPLDESDGDELLLHSDPPNLPGRRLHFKEPVYHQNFDGFEPGMSILDLLFNHGPEARSILESGIVGIDGVRNNGSDT